MNCTICGLPTGNIVGSVLPQCKCGWQAPQPPKAQPQEAAPRKPLTDEEVMDAYCCETPLFNTYLEAFIAGIRISEVAHGITGKKE